MTEFVLGKIKFTWQGNWAVSTVYEKDDIVKYGGNTYVCITGHTSGSAIPDFYTDIAKWNVHVEGVTHKGDHADATYYKINDIVKSDQHQYICTTQHTSTATINLTNFTLYVQGGLVAAQAGKSGQFLSTDGTNTTWVDIVEAAPGALDTLNELAASLADDADFAGTMTTALAGKEPTLTAGTVAQYYRGDKTWQVPTDTTYTAGDGLDLTGTAFSTDLKANGGLDIDSTELSVAQGISQYDVAQFAASVADDDFLRIDGTAVEGRSASEVLSDIAALPLAGGTMTGTIAADDQQITKPRLTDYSETVNAIGSITSGTNADLEDGNVQSVTMTANTFNFGITNAVASHSNSLTLIITNGGLATVTWLSGAHDGGGNAIQWAGGTAAELTSSGTDIVTFTTFNGGTNWYGFSAGIAMAAP